MKKIYIALSGLLLILFIVSGPNQSSQSIRKDTTVSTLKSIREYSNEAPGEFIVRKRKKVVKDENTDNLSNPQQYALVNQILTKYE